MRRTLLLVTAIAAGAYVAGRRVQPPGGARTHHTAYQRAALIWTSPRVVRARRALRKRTR